MKSLILEAYNSGLTIQDIDPPIFKEGHSILKTSHVALNHRDVWICKGKYPGVTFPIQLGSDLCGFYKQERKVINPGLNWGSSESHFNSDFQVLGVPTTGTFAEMVSVPHAYVYDAPSHLTDVEAAALPLAGVTAFRVLLTRCNAKAGETILISGIGGGVSLMVMQFAIAIGMKVFVTSGSEEKIQKALQLGATFGVNYNTDKWDTILKNEMGEAHVIIDSAGGPAFHKFLKLAAPGGRIGVYGGGLGSYTDLSPQIIFWKQLSILGSTMGSPTDFQNMLEFVSSKNIKPIVDSVFHYTEVNDALNRMEQKEQFGKIVLSFAS